MTFLRQEGWGLKSLGSQAWHRNSRAGEVSADLCTFSSAFLSPGGRLTCLNVCARCFLSHMVPFSLRLDYVFPFICVLNAGLWLQENTLCGGCWFRVCAVPAACRVPPVCSVPCAVYLPCAGEGSLGLHGATMDT